MNSETAPSPARSWCLPIGLAGLFLWLLGGLTLESFHGFKFAAYLEDSNRRLVWTLAHSHGTLLSLACLVLWLLFPRLSLPLSAARLADRLFASGAVLMPLGFFLSGFFPSESDPGLPVVLVPPGALLCAAGLAVILLRKNPGH